MNEQKPRSDKAFQLDQRLALHQKTCWLILVGLALLGAAAIALYAPENARTALSVVLIVALMLVYGWASNAPTRAMKEWVRRMIQDRSWENAQAFLDFLLKLEQALPSTRKKEMAFTINQNKAALLNTLGRKEEALALLRSFDQIWDPSMKDRINELIQIISGEAAPDDEPKEQP